MPNTPLQSIYDITKTYEENVKLGPNPDFRATITSKKPKETYKILGFTINSPFGASASPTGADSRFIKVMFDNGYDVVVTKTRRSVHYQPNTFPNVVHIVPGKIDGGRGFEELPDRQTAKSSEYETLTIANSYGNNSLDPEYWIPDAKIANSYATEGKLLINNIVGTIQPGFSEEDYYRDFAKTALLAKASGAKAIEINLSCPNVTNEGVLCYNKDAVIRVCRLVRQAVGDEMPLVAKLGFFPLQEHELLVEIVTSIAPFISGISSINTFAAPVYDEQGKQAMPGKGRLKAGISGHAIKDLGLDMTNRLYDIRERNELKFDIISAGGVLTPEDFDDYRHAGADLVLSATGAMWNPNLAHQIKNSL